MDKQPQENPISKLTDDQLVNAYLGELVEPHTDDEFLTQLQNECEKRKIDPLTYKKKEE